MAKDVRDTLLSSEASGNGKIAAAGAVPGSVGAEAGGPDEAGRLMAAMEAEAELLRTARDDAERLARETARGIVEATGERSAIEATVFRGRTAVSPEGEAMEVSAEAKAVVLAEPEGGHGGHGHEHGEDGGEDHDGPGDGQDGPGGDGKPRRKGLGIGAVVAGAVAAVRGMIDKPEADGKDAGDPRDPVPDGEAGTMDHDEMQAILARKAREEQRRASERDHWDTYRPAGRDEAPEDAARIRGGDKAAEEPFAGREEPDGGLELG